MEAHLAPSAATLTDKGEPQLWSSPVLCRDFTFMQHVLLRLILSLQWFNPKVRQTLYLLFFFYFWNSNGFVWFSSNLWSGKKYTVFFITKEGEKQVEDFFFFFPRSQFPKEMRHIPLSCVWRGGQTVTLLGSTVCSICHIFEVNSENMQSKSEGENRQELTFSPLQLRACGTEPEGLEPKLGETCRFWKYNIPYRQIGVTTMLRSSSLL